MPIELFGDQDVTQIFTLAQEHPRPPELNDDVTTAAIKEFQPQYGKKKLQARLRIV